LVLTLSRDNGALTDRQPFELCLRGAVGAFTA
jgi:hypothetical protein